MDRVVDRIGISCLTIPVSQPRVVVDGYNLVHQMPELARHIESDLEYVRDRLIALLANYQATRGVKVTVVFDGRGVQAGPRRPAAGGVEVVYSRAPQNADQCIKATIAREKHPRACTVVTSDNSIICHVRDFGAKTISSAAFAAKLVSGAGRDASGTRRQTSTDKPEMSPADVAEWENYFKKKGGSGTSKGWY